MLNSLECKFVVLGFLICCPAVILASAGDKSPHFRSCTQHCRLANCSQPQNVQQKYTDNELEEYLYDMFLWSCEDHCNYDCMWRTTERFRQLGWNVPQFYGKWPFKRFYGIQEPASVVFSIMNFAANWKGITHFRKTVRSDSPMYLYWHVMCGIYLNGWIWSIVFHIRDFPITELFDYTFAYSMVLATFTGMLLRMLRSRTIVQILISIASVLFFVNHFIRLSVGSFDYSYNMKVNVLTGILGGSGWMIWYFVTYRTTPYAWKMCAFQLLAAASLSLEMLDFPPILWTFDAHALWHLLTVPLTILFYSFISDDCKALRRQMYDSTDVSKKMI